MTPSELATLQAEVDTVINTAGTIGSAIAPQYAAFIVLGQALAKQFPALLNDVENLLSKKDPTPEDNQAVSAKIVSLLNPESL